MERTRFICTCLQPICGYNTHNINFAVTILTTSINRDRRAADASSQPPQHVMSESFLQACEARAADVDLWKGATTTTRLPYLAFATKDVQAKIKNSVILDARASPLAPFDLHRDGFTLIDRRSELSSLLPKIADAHNRPDVVRDAYPAVARFVEALGKQRGKRRWRAITHSHMHRYTVQCPSFTVHNDYTHPDQGPKQAAKVINGRETACEAAMKLPRTRRTNAPHRAWP